MANDNSRQTQLVVSFRMVFIGVTLFIGTNLPGEASSERILAVALMSVRSHKITYEPLLEELAARGHNVTLVSSLPSNQLLKNVRQISTTTNINTSVSNILDLKERGFEFGFADTLEIYGQNCIRGLSSPLVQELRKEYFDLIFIPAVFNECGLAYASTFKTITVLISAAHVPETHAGIYGNPSWNSFIPSQRLSISIRGMNFYERVLNFLVRVEIRFYYGYLYFRSIEAEYRKALNDTTIPSVRELVRNTSLILVNTQHSLTLPRPYLPNIVEVGGMHCRPPKILPFELEHFVNSSGVDGFILFSMGSALEANQMSNIKRDTLLKTFSVLKQKVILKWESETIPNLPRNVLLSKWVPQQDLLGHPKIKLFITHGGFGSLTEAVYHGVPIIGIPIFADQYGNMKSAEEEGYGITLNFNQLTEAGLFDVIQEVINNTGYKENAERLSRIFRDQPDKPLDRAVFWTEYVMRHKGAVHMKSAAMDLNVFEYYSLDVIGLIGFICAVILYISVTFTKFILKSNIQFRNDTIKKKN